MGNHFNQIFYICGVLLMVCAIAFASSISKGGTVQDLRHLGHADGVDYYSEEALFMSWYSARAYCEFSNMTLAKILTKNQASLLRGSMARESWTSARLSQLPTSFVWDDMPNTHPSLDVITNYNLRGAVGLEVCGAIMPDSLDFELRAYRCDREAVFPLCQTSE